jgi:hypothetical protein
MKGTMAKLNKRKTMTSPRAKRGVGKRFYDFFSLVENQPYGASLMHEKKVARVAMGVGVLVMDRRRHFFNRLEISCDLAG